MTWTPSPRPDAIPPEALAEALLAGLDARRPAPLPPVPAPVAVDLGRGRLAELAAAAGVRGLPAPRGGRLGGRVGRTVRRAAKVLLNPWLDQQTRFNHAAVEHLHEARWAAAHLADLTAAHTAQTAAHLTATADHFAALAARVNDLFHDVRQLRAGGPPAGGGPDPVAAIERLFLVTRLAPPPGRVLVAGADPRAALDLAGLGYEVVLAGRPADPVVHPALRVAPADGPADPGGGFDAVVGFAGPAPALWAASGGRVFGADPVGGGVPAPAEVARRVAPLRLSEVVYAVRAGDGWELAADPDPAAERVLWVAVKK